MLTAVLSLLVGAGCVSWRLMALRRVIRAAPARFFGIATAQRPKTRAAWSAWPLDRHGPDHGLVHAMFVAERRGPAVARLNEHLAEVDAELRQAQGLSTARIALGSGALLAAITVAHGLPEPGWSPTSAVLALSFGFVSAGAVWQLDRLADARARRIRAEWDDWANALERLLPPERAAGGIRGCSLDPR